MLNLCKLLLASITLIVIKIRLHLLVFNFMPQNQELSLISHLKQFLFSQ